MRHCGMVLGYHNPRLSMLAVDSILANPGVDAILVEPDAREKDLNLLKDRYGDNPRVIILPEKDNKYCAWGMNQGIKEALRLGYDYITVMNDDATIDPGYFQTVEKEFEDPGVGIVQPKTMFGFTDILYSAGVIRNVVGFPLLRGYGQRDDGKFDGKETEYASMVVSTIRRTVFERIGLLDETYIMYYDDIDFSIRALAAGWKIAYCSTAISRHHTLQAVGQTNKKFLAWVYQLSERNKLLMAHKNGFLSLPYVLMDILHALKVCIVSPGLIVPVVKGKLWFWGGYIGLA